MPKYVILDADSLDSAVVSEDVDSPELAVQSVPLTTPLPDRAVIVKRGDVIRARIIGVDEQAPTVIRRTNPTG